MESGIQGIREKNRLQIDNVSQGERQEMRFNNNRELRQQQQYQDRASVNGLPDGGRQDTSSSLIVKTTVIVCDSMIKQIDC